MKTKRKNRTEIESETKKSLKSYIIGYGEWRMANGDAEILVTISQREFFDGLVYTVANLVHIR